ncbi:MAG: hypothetical protein AAFR98_05405 [Pseudomonadota bacterium]
MVLNRRSALFSLMASATLVAGAPLLAADWQLLGTSNVNLAKNFTILRVGLGEGLFKRIRIKVAEERIVIENLEVTYSNGDMLELNLRATIPAGGESRVIDLPDGIAHGIRSIRMQHKRIPTGGTAVVSIYGAAV